MLELRLGVIGAGFVGGAVINAFNNNTVMLSIVDTNAKKATCTFEEMMLEEPEAIFVCLPTPCTTKGDVNASAIFEVLDKLLKDSYKGVVIIKSTITPDKVKEMKHNYPLHIVYNPEFLTEANAHEDFKHPSMQILGGDWKDCEEAERIYLQHSDVKIVPTFKTDIVTASLLKYTINSWLATKVVFMNELKELHDRSGATSSWEQFSDMLRRDERIGDSHLKVPGPDGQYGFGGHCFPKDTTAFLEYARSLGADMEVLRYAVRKNNLLRGK